MRGASALQDALERAGSLEVSVWVVWERVLATDIAPPTSGVLAEVRDRRAEQFWDPQLRCSRAFLRAAMTRRERLPSWMELGEDTVIWDMVAVYAPGETWQDRFGLLQDLPPFPAKFGAPVVDVAGELEGWMREAAAAAP